MPARRESVAVTDNYRQTFSALNRRTRAQASNGLRQLITDRADIDAQSDAYLTFSVAAVGTAAAAQAALADTYLARFLSSELREPVSPSGMSTRDYARFDQFGRPLIEAMRPAIYTTRLALIQGYDMDASTAFGAARAARIAGTITAAAGRGALADLMSQSELVSAYVRVCEDDACGACLALTTGEPLEPGEPLGEHPNCNCTAEPLARGVKQRIERPTGQEIFESKSQAEQDALFAGRGGAEKAQLIRDGMPLSDLVKTESYAIGGSPVITEAPLASLTA